MCKKGNPRKIDGCMENLIRVLNDAGLTTLACCCGHGKYPMTIVIQRETYIVEIVSGYMIPRKTRFYKRDELGVFYIPESLLEKKQR